jgi:16S rRNA U516 pseudouridylate synthase RsuA-like enzyme
VPVSVEILPPNAGRGVPGAIGRNAAAASADGGGSGAFLLRIVVAEGRKREVRTMVDAAGLLLQALHRARVGGYTLPRGVPLGAFLELTANQARSVLREVPAHVKGAAAAAGGAVIDEEEAD